MKKKAGRRSREPNDSRPSTGEELLVEGARQNNLKDLTVRIPLHELVVVTGVSGSGKSSLAFDTIYAEGQRRYVETFSPYARQFLERMDKPRVDRIEGIPPAIAIDQTNPVRTSRSTVGTMTELTDHLKLLYARAAMLHCRGCGRPVRRDTPESIVRELLPEAAVDAPIPALVTFPVAIPESFTKEEILVLLERQGYTRVRQTGDASLEVVQDRLPLDARNRSRWVESLEAALRLGRGRVTVFLQDPAATTQTARAFSAELHCADCDLTYEEPAPNAFSFNSPMGACPTCRGFGRTMGIDLGLVVPDESKTLADGAVKPWQTKSYRECQEDLLRFARKRGIPVDVPWRDLLEEPRRWVVEGEGEWEDRQWYGVRRFFDWLESKSYRMHIRVLLSRYRSYDTCAACRGARLRPDALLWRVGSRDEADRALAGTLRFRAAGMSLSDEALAALPGLSLHDVTMLPIERSRGFFRSLSLPAPLDEAAALLLHEIRTRLDYLVEVGLGYLTLDRQSRTLSGGEVQRINLTTALGTSLVNTLFVLDEPTIGLHARDVGRVVGVLERLRDAGNSLVVVEHDPHVMLAADRILDVGPGPGERGGEIVFHGTPAELLRSRRSLTASYLRGERSVLGDGEWRREPVDDSTAHLEIRGAVEHNLKDVDVRLPLGRLVCVAGVSGSGKSTLVRDVLYAGLRKLRGLPVDAAGRCREISGHEGLEDVVLVDASPIGKTARSNPASYVGAFDPIRKRFAAEPMARARGYTAGTFSFNSGEGRCPTCSGSGFEHVEMQFLSDVYLRCTDCDGRRYRPEVLEIEMERPASPRRASIADVLDMTVSEALAFFADDAEVCRVLEPLVSVGLGYVTLGQPVPTLSGGEAQRLKLAGHMAKAGSADPRRRTRSRGSLLLFDEPTKGLHLDDIAVLLQAFRALRAQGHSLVVIEHNLDVIRAADWVIELGPEGGEDGGRIVCTGTPSDVEALEGSHTGAALREHVARLQGRSVRSPRRRLRARRSGADSIQIHNASEHNLRGIDVRIPRDRFTVITGVSGSGKSTLAFDILFAEGQRRYLESLNAYARQFVQPAARPDVDSILGIPPTVAIEQRTSRGGRKSTVATMTELYPFLRILFARLGEQSCPDCDLPIEAQTPGAMAARLVREHEGKRIELLAPLVIARKGYYTDLARWAAGKGFAELRVDGRRVPTSAWPRLDRFKEHDIDAPVGDLRVSAETERELRALLDRALDLGRGTVRVSVVSAPRARRGTLKGATEWLLSAKRSCPRCARSFEELDPRLFSFHSRHGWCPRCYGTGLLFAGFDDEQTGEERWWNEWWGGEERPCPACDGRRLRPEALAVRFQGRTIAELTSASVDGLERELRGLRLSSREARIARDALAELRGRLGFLREVGLSYLALDRAAPTLSGGEAQRVRLAAQLGSNLRGVCYILDEPTIGLHPRDHRMLLDTLEALRRNGNTVVVVEHDEETIRRAEHVIDLGPGGGVNGGEVVAQGTPAGIMRNPASITGRFLARKHRSPRTRSRVTDDPTSWLRIVGADLHNLKKIDVGIPLGRLVCVTGVSGSGKSTLVRDVLYQELARRLSKKRATRSRTGACGCREIRGWERVNRVLEVDQAPIGRTPRSCTATYVGLWDEVRKLFAGTPEARVRGYSAARFSFNVPGGRCEACQGQGVQRIELGFLPDVEVSCEGCAGRRFGAETLEIRFKDRTISDVLAMSVTEAVDFFAAHPRIHAPLRWLDDVGLGYLTLGQRSPTLSGGEAQRIKLVTELARIRPGGAASARSSTLYVLDEPTIGLHMADVDRLIGVLRRLVSEGNTVVVIEHDMNVVAAADWVVDLGPEGGEGGGRVVAEGTPDSVARRARTHTARALAEAIETSEPSRERGRRAKEVKTESGRGTR